MVSGDWSNFVIGQGHSALQQLITTIMKKIRILFLLFLIVCLSAKGQNLSTTIKVQAMDMGSALMKNDFATFI